MRFLSIDKLRPGDRIAKAIHNKDGLLELSEQSVLTNDMINILKRKGYTNVCIDDEISKDITIEEIVSEQLRMETATRLKDIMLRNGNIMELMPNITNIVDSVIANRDVIANMVRILDYHEYTYLHCVNVSIYAVLIGIKLGYTLKELVDLGAAGMLHDIGKKSIPTNILDKPGRLTREEFEVIKKHPRLGYEALKNCIEIASTTKAAVLQHHERYDGSGYPQGLAGEKIHKFARILAIADTYDAMVSDRVYHKAIPPYEAIEFLMGTGNRLFDSNILAQFLQCVSAYPVGCCVRLSDGNEAIVVKNYSDSILRPLVRLLETGKLIDLKYDKFYLNLCITEIMA